MSWTQLAVIPVLSLLLLVHEFGHFIVARLVGIRVEEFGIGLPPRLFGFRRGEVLYSLNLIPLGAFVRMTGEDGDPSQSGSFASKSKLARAAVLFAGPAMNFLTAALFFAAAYTAGWPTPSGVSVYRVSPGSPAETAGLQIGDRVVAMDGRRVENAEQFVTGTRAKLGKPVVVTLERAGAQLDKTIVPRTSWPEGDGPLGVGLQVKTTPVSYPVHEALPLGLAQTWKVVAFTLSMPVMVLQGLIPAEAARVTGPVGIFQMTAQAADVGADTGWWFPLIFLTANVSAGLAIANLLPLPALDGGRLLLVGVEAIRRRRITPEREGALHFVGLMVLIALMVVVSYYDVISPLPNIDWGPR